jgi:hypothetical protein
MLWLHANYHTGTCNETVDAEYRLQITEAFSFIEPVHAALMMQMSTVKTT